MAPVDFVAAAVGAIVGCVPNASGTSFVEGAVTLVTVLVVDGLIARQVSSTGWPASSNMFRESLSKTRGQASMGSAVPALRKTTYSLYFAEREVLAGIRKTACALLSLHGTHRMDH
jgi:hypothetical protein